MTQRIEPMPPSDVDAEKAVLGALLKDPSAIPSAAVTLRPEDFYSEKNRQVYQALLDLGPAVADVVTLEGLLTKRGLYDGIGWAYTNELVNDNPTHLHLPHYAQRVSETARRRRWIDTAGKIAGAAYGENGDLDPAELAREMLAGDWLPGSGGWEWRTLEDACRPKPPRQYLAGGMLPLPSLSTFYGPSGTLKSLLVMDLAICVAAGLDWLDPLPGKEGTGRPCEAAPVLWIDVDNGADTTEERLEAVMKAHDAPVTAPLRYLSFPSPPFVARDSGSAETVIQKALDLGARLIVFDNLGTISGNADENSSEMIAVMSGLRRIAEETGAAVIVIHHRNKTQGRARAGDALRGHSSIEAALDLALQVERAEGEDVITVKSTKTRRAPVDPFSALWTYENNGPDLVAGRFFGLGRPETESGALTKREQAETCIMIELRDGMTQGEIVKLVKDLAGVGRNTALAALQGLTRQKRLYTRAGGTGQPVIYERPAAEVV
jgi:hypothetical protein